MMAAGKQKQDPKKLLGQCYTAPAGQFAVVEIPKLSYFMIDGAGDPNVAAAYREAVETLFSASYALKFMSKKEAGLDYVVPPLEGLWWADDMTDFVARKKQRWRWTAIILIPDFVDPLLPERALSEVARKKALPGLKHIRVESLHEGLCVQTLHVGSYDDEGPTLESLHQKFLPDNGLKEAGHHHEIYLSDARRVLPAKLKTILRQPVARQ